MPNPESKGALVVGGTLAGIQAALDLARSGIPVCLVEESPFLGHGAPNGDALQALPHHLLNARLLEVTKHPIVQVMAHTSVHRLGGEAGRFQVELRQRPRFVDLTKCTACEDCIDVCPVVVPGTDHKAIYLAENGQPGCATIDKLGKAPCANTCPGGIHVQGYVALIAQGRFQEALDLIRQAIPFPGICGRICTHPCELNCRRAEVDEAVSIRLLKRFVADWELAQGLETEASAPENGQDKGGEESSPPVEPGTPSATAPGSEAKCVAVIGAGPAGMAVADSLARRGHSVTVFEASPLVGGMMSMGIPSYRLPRSVIQREIGRIEERGVDIRLNSPIGPGGAFTLDDLFDEGYDAVFCGVGAHRAYRLRTPGQDLQGVVTGIDLLKALNLSQQTGDPHWHLKVQSYLLGGASTRVAVIGGGNTAMDVARSLKRLGVDDVRVLYRRTRAEMPAMPEEIEEAEHEGIPVEFLVSPVRIVGDEQGRVVALECVRMKLGEPDHSGRRRPIPMAGSGFTIQLDMVVPAIGQSPDLSFLGPDHGFAITREGTFNVDRISYMTNRPGVFAAGDAITQPVSVIDAIGSAKQAAAGIDAYLRSEEAQDQSFSARELPIAQRELLPEELAPKARHASPAIPMARRLNSYDEVELGYDAATAIAEAQRCLMCGPCSECLACEVVCKPKAIVHDDQEHYDTLQFGAVIWASGSNDAQQGAGTLAAEAEIGGRDGRPGFYFADPADPLSGSAASARAMIDLFAQRHPAASSGLLPGITGAARIGVFVCQCTGQISGTVDTDALEAQAGTWQAVAHSQVLAQACSEEAADAIYQAVASQNLNRVVLAACSCCTADQVCYSCTYQRVRCKDNLLGRHYDPGNPLFEFVNIREQCAWAHEDDPETATATALAMVAAAVAKTRLSVAWPGAPESPDRTVLLVGNGPAATICERALSAQHVEALRVLSVPARIRQTPGHFTLLYNGSNSRQGSALVLAPKDSAEFDAMRAAFDTPGRQPRPRSVWGSADTHRPGVFWCEPAADAVVAGMAAAARTAAWLGQEHGWPQVPPACVDQERCRGCGDCEQVCEFGAIQLQGEGEDRIAWVDSAICLGCGICATRCPAGAIATGHPGGAQFEAMLEAILA